MDLIKAGASVVDSQNPYSEPLLIQAIRNNNSELFKILLETPNIYLVSRDVEDCCAVNVASSNGSVEMLRLLLEKLKTSVSDEQFQSMLNDRGADTIAVGAGRQHRLKRRGVAPIHSVLDEWENYTDQFSENLEEEAIEKIKLLLDYGARADVYNHEGSAVIHNAVALQSPKLVQVILDHGIDVNCQESAGDEKLTPLQYAILNLSDDEQDKEREFSVIKLLLQHGADIDFKDNSQRKSAYELARDLAEEHPEVFALLQEYKLAKDSATAGTSQLPDSSSAKRVKSEEEKSSEQEFAEEALPDSSPQNPTAPTSKQGKKRGLR
jgi:ankyrin repeat protein